MSLSTFQKTKHLQANLERFSLPDIFSEKQNHMNKNHQQWYYADATSEVTEQRVKAV